MIRRNLYISNNNDSSHSSYWNDEDDSFEYQVNKWGVDKSSKNSHEKSHR